MRRVDASQDTDVETAIAAGRPDTAKPLLDAPQSMAAGIAMWVAVVLPLAGLAVAIPVGWGWGLSVLDLTMAVIGYVVTGLAVTVGYHRGFTHRSFRARRGLRIALAIGGSLAVEGSPVHLGGQPPPPPRLLRPGRRPALTLAVRDGHPGPAEGHGSRARGLDAETRAE